MGLADLPYLTERKAAPVPKGKTRLELTADARPLTKVDDKAFRDQVWIRDHYHCRCCGRAVLRTIERVPEQGHVHHIHGRGGDLRFESRAACLLCALCHARCKGQINGSRLILLAARRFRIDGIPYTDARYPIRFEEA